MEKCSKFLGPQTCTEPNWQNLHVVTSQFSLPKDFEAYLAGYKQPTISWDSETQASQLLRQERMPTAMQQKISLPLDPRRGGSIHLPEEAIQLAKSQASVAVRDTPIRAKSTTSFEGLSKSDPAYWVALYEYYQSDAPVVLSGMTLLEFLQYRQKHYQQLMKNYQETLKELVGGKYLGVHYTVKYVESRIQMYSQYVSAIEQTIAQVTTETNGTSVEKDEIPF